MDFIPQPLGSTLGPIDVPLVVDNLSYEIGTFEDFPLQSGFTDHQGLLNLRDKGSDEITSLLQSWLYFGLLSEFLGRRVSIEEFTSEKVLPDGSIIKVVKTSLLAETSTFANLHLADDHDRLWKILEVGEENIHLADTQLHSRAAKPIPEIVLSIKVLIYALSSYAFPTERHPNLEVKALDTVLGRHSSPATALLISRMIDAGWCPFQTYQLCRDHPCAIVYFLSQLDRRYQKGLTHSNCTEDICTANNIDMDIYPTKHVCSECICSASQRTNVLEGNRRRRECERCSCAQSEIEVDVERVRDIVCEGGVPLISINCANDVVTLNVEKLTATSRYVAMSHVWSDGMGNPKSNALPRCILKRLGNFLDDLPLSSREHPSRWLTGLIPMSVHMARRTGFRMGDPKPTLFWMDTLCIPVGQEHETLRINAINQMAFIYAAASQVLILDSELQRHRIGASLEPEILGHILCCAWQTRCWTLQEGALARSRRFQFGDGIMDVETPRPSRRELFYGRMSFRTVVFWILPGYLRSWRKSLRKRLRVLRKDRYVRRQHHTLDEIVSQAITRELRINYHETLQKYWSWDVRDNAGQAKSEAVYQQFISVWNGLGCRTTTQRADLCLILANLLDLNSYELIHLGTYEEKMKTILWNVGPRLPASLLYNNAGPRSRSKEDHANRWLPEEPSSTSMKDIAMMLSEDNVTLSSDEAIKSGAFLLLVHTPLHPRFRKLVIHDAATGKWHRVELFREDGDAIDTSAYSYFCILVEGLSFSDDFPSNAEMRGACLLTNTNPESGSLGSTNIAAKYDCPARVRMSETGEIDMADGDEYPLAGTSLSTPWELVIDADFHNPLLRLHRRPLQPYAAPYAVYMEQLAFYFAFVITYHFICTFWQMFVLVKYWPTLNWVVRARFLLWMIGYMPKLIYYVDYIHIPLLIWFMGELWVSLIKPLFAIDTTELSVTQVVLFWMVKWFAYHQMVLFYLVLSLYPLIAVLYLYVVPRAHDAWVATFKEGWHPDTSHKWFWFTSRSISRLFRLLEFLSSGIEAWLNRLAGVVKRMPAPWRFVRRRDRNGGFQEELRTVVV